jgi:parallel beta-helix repeat protein
MDGIDFDVTTSNSLAYANTSRGNVRYGVFVEEGASLNTIFANTCSSNEIGINLYSSATGTTIRNSLVANVCDSNQRGIRFGAATGLETSHNFAFNNTLTNSSSKGLDAQSVGTENYCSQQYFSGNVATIGGTTGSAATGWPLKTGGAGGSWCGCAPLRSCNAVGSLNQSDGTTLNPSPAG